MSGPAKEAEEKCYREWTEKEREKLGEPAPEPLLMHPFSEEEWEQRGEEKYEDMRDEDMSILGMGAFMTTYRMRNANGECFAVKAVERRVRQTVERAVEAAKAAPQPPAEELTRDIYFSQGDLKPRMCNSDD